MGYDTDKYSFLIALALYIWCSLQFPLTALFGSFYPRLTYAQVDLQGKLAIVTGANSGVGFEVARALAGMGAHVILPCRNEVRGAEARDKIIQLTGNPRVDLEILDCASFESVREFLDRWESRSVKTVDILVNNAVCEHCSDPYLISHSYPGVMTGILGIIRDNFEQTYQSNHLAHLLLTHELFNRGHFSPTDWIVSVTSGGMHFSDALNEHNRAGWDVVARYDNEAGRRMSAEDMIQLYVRTKLSQVMWTMALQRRFDKSEKWKNVTAHTCHPSFVQTAIWRRSDGSGATSGMILDVMRFLLDGFGVPGEQCAAISVWLATAPEPATKQLRGRYWDRKQWQRLAPWALDEQRQEALWDMWCSDAGAPSI